MSDTTPWKPADTVDAILQFVWDAALKSGTADEDQEAAKALALDKAREMLDADIRDEDATAELFRQACKAYDERLDEVHPFDFEASRVQLMRRLGLDDDEKGGTA